jgi:hypothetical protein
MKVPEGQTPPEVADLISDVIKDKVVCDVGCGGGSFMVEMARYAKEVIGIEEEEEWGRHAANRGFDVYGNNVFFHPLPEADVYYIWNKSQMGIFLKAKYEGTKGTFILGLSERPSTKKFLEELNAEVREVNGFKVYITTL